VRCFEMPGTGIVDFDAHARAIARAGIYDFGIHHAQILVPVVLRHWGVEALTGLTDAAKRARDALIQRIDRVGNAARRLARRRAEAAERGLSTPALPAPA
jgi:acyl-[acyl-carrier-protein] desaturase